MHKIDSNLQETTTSFLILTPYITLQEKLPLASVLVTRLNVGGPSVKFRNHHTNTFNEMCILALGYVVDIAD